MIRCDSTGHGFPHRDALLHGSTESTTLVGWLRRNEGVAISAVVWTEFLCGPIDAEDIATAAEIFGDPVRFDANVATAATSLFNAGSDAEGHSRIA